MKLGTTVATAMPAWLTQTTVTTPKHIDFLDGLRAVAILGVLLCHTYAEVYGYGHEFAPWHGWYRTFAADSAYWFYPFSLGRGGVALFFVISGFCIHLSFRQSEQTWGGFFIRRFFRLYPAYILALIFVMVMLFMRHLSEDVRLGYFWNQFSTHALFIHNFFSGTFKGTNAALWSLAVEVQLYLLYPLLIALSAKLGWRKSLLMLAGLEVSLQAAAGMASAAGTAWGHVIEISANTPFGFWFSWALGAVIADAYLKKQPLPFVKIHPLFWLGLVVLMDFIKPLGPFWFTGFALCGAGLISRCLSASKPGILGFMLSWKVLAKIGLWSYSLYLLHYPLLEVYNNLVDWYFPQSHQSRPMYLLLMFCTWAAIIPMAGLWYQTIEIPGIALGKRLLKKNAGDSVQQQKNVKRPKAATPPVRAAKTYAVSLSLLFVFIIANIKAGAQFAPAAPGEFANLAWSLATNPDAMKRDGALAIKYAEKACRQTGYSESSFVCILAAAYAEVGRFDDAISAAKYASNLAAQSGDKNALQMNQALLQLYVNHQPYHNGSVAGK